MSVRQFKRLARAWRAEGDGGLVSRQRGRRSHRRMSDGQRAAAADVCRLRGYAGLGEAVGTGPDQGLGRDGAPPDPDRSRPVAAEEAAGQAGVPTARAAAPAHRPWTKTADDLDRALACTAYGTYAVPDPAEDEKTLDVRVEAIIAARRTSQGAAALAGA